MTTLTGRRRWVVATVVAVALVSAGGGWWASRLVTTPAQAAANAAPPPASVITAPVERRTIAETLVTRGNVAPARAIQIRLRAPVDGQPVITAVHVGVGDTVAQGTALVEIAGRPVLAIGGQIPVYRDLRPGTSGEDVRQLQEALTALGHPVAADGDYGPATAGAVRDWYQAAGFDPAPASADDDERLEAARDQVLAAQRSLEDARDVAAAAATDPEASKTPSRTVTRATEDLSRAKRALAEVETTTGPSVPASELVVLGSLPAQVRAVDVAVGDTVGDAGLTFSSGDLGVAATLSAHMTGLVHPGQSVQLDSEVLGQQATGTVGEVLPAGVASADGGVGGSAAGASATDTGPQFTVVPDQPLAAEWNGQDVRVTVIGASSDGPVLVVPLAAVSAGADERTRVSVLDDDGTRRQVEVRTGVVGAGYVQVAPVDAALEPGQKVVVGVDSGSSGSTGTPTTPSTGPTP